MTETNRRIVLAARPVGFPKETDFRLEEAPMPEPGEGEILVRTNYLSLDPYMRGRMNEGASYAPGVELGEVMVGGTVGDVVRSRHAAFAEGDMAQVQTGWQAYGLAKGEEARKVDPELAPVSTSLGVLGMPGITAYFGLLEVGKPQEGETVVVSGAAGAVGSLVGQIAQIKGCRAVGIAGSDEKVSYVQDELGFAGAFNYKTTADYEGALAALCPDGIDVYFDNVGGPISDAVFAQLNIGARISVCGQISQYNLSGAASDLAFYYQAFADARFSRLRFCRALCRGVGGVGGLDARGQTLVSRGYFRGLRERANRFYWHAAR
jgi:NADPH:quinone reductase